MGLLVEATCTACGERAFLKGMATQRRTFVCRACGVRQGWGGGTLVLRAEGNTC